MNKQPINPDIVSEFLGQFQFSKNQKQDVATAEAIANNSYTSMSILYATCAGYAVGKYPLLESIKENPFFKPSFESHP